VVELASGVYDETVPVTVNGFARDALVVLRDGVQLRGAGRNQTFLRGAPAFYGITAEGVGGRTIVRDLTLDGALVQAVNLRGASPTLERVDVRNAPTGGSSVSLDARDGSFPVLVDCVLDGGHGALFVEFGSGGLYRRCRLGRRPYETLSVVGSDPVLEDCVLEGAGRSTVVLSQNAFPTLTRCVVGRGDAWTVRVVGYPPATTIDLSGNTWFTDDAEAIAAAILDAEDQTSLGARVRFLPLADVVSTGDSSIGGLKRSFSRGD
jgi:hypothetical protein